MSSQRTAVNYLGSTINIVNTNLVNLSSGVNTLSTNIDGRFSTQSLSFITSNITLSNSATSPNYQGYALTSSNAGIFVNSDQFAQIKISNPVNPLAEILFDTIATGGTFAAVGSGISSRGAYWFVGSGDAINIGSAGNVSISNAGVVNSNYTLYVNGTTGIQSTLTITGGGLQVTNTTLTNSVFYSTNLTMYNGNFLQSNVDSTTSYATFYSTAMTVHGSISTTGTLYCLGRLNTPNVANVSTLIVGDNIASTAKISLDIHGSYRTRVQYFSTNGTIRTNGGNLIFASNGAGLTLNLPTTDGAEIGTLFTMHSETTGSMYISSTGGDIINAGSNLFTVAKQTALTSIMCLGSGIWTVIEAG